MVANSITKPLTTCTISACTLVSTESVTAPLCSAPRISEPKMMPAVESFPISAAVMPLKPISAAKLL